MDRDLPLQGADVWRRGPSAGGEEIHKAQDDLSYLLSRLFKRGRKVSSGTVDWYISTYGTDFDNSELPGPPNVALLRALRSLFDGIWGVLKASWGLLVYYPIRYLDLGRLWGKRPEKKKKKKKKKKKTMVMKFADVTGLAYAA